MMGAHEPPGLVSREIIGRDGDTVTIREVWDTRVAGCPVISVRLQPFEINRDATICARSVTLTGHELREWMDRMGYDE